MSSATLYRLTDGAERLFFRLTLVADDYGRFEADPQVLKARCFPLWPDSKMNARRIRALYEELEAADLVKSYIIDGKSHGFFVTWERHQKRRAKHSKYPAPTADSICSQMSADVLRLPAYVPEKREARSEVREARNTALSGEPDPAAPSAIDEWGEPEHLIALYNRLVPAGHPKVERASPARLLKARQYLRTFPERAFWVRVFTEIKFSALLQGLRPSPGHESFKGTFDWLLTKGRDGTENCVKVSEGKYRDKEHA